MSDTSSSCEQDFWEDAWLEHLTEVGGGEGEEGGDQDGPDQHHDLSLGHNMIFNQVTNEGGSGEMFENPDNLDTLYSPSSSFKLYMLPKGLGLPRTPPGGGVGGA